MCCLQFEICGCGSTDGEHASLTHFPMGVHAIQICSKKDKEWLHEYVEVPCTWSSRGCCEDGGGVLTVFSLRVLLFDCRVLRFSVFAVNPSCRLIERNDLRLRDVLTFLFTLATLSFPCSSIAVRCGGGKRKNLHTFSTTLE